MTLTQLHTIFDGRDSNEELHKQFHSVEFDNTLTFYFAYYPKIELDYNNGFYVCTHEDGTKEFYNMDNTMAVRENRAIKDEHDRMLNALLPR
jgi:hypothetical protein